MIEDSNANEPSGEEGARGNYLISAYSINPYHGSEDGIGWNWVLQHEKHYKQGDRIIVLTKRFNERDTRRGFEEYGIRHVELAIVDVPDWLNWFREKYSMFHHMYYILWQHWAWLWVKKSGIRFDVIHHVTMNDYRIPSEMFKVKNAKIIWGPVGGAQVTPKALKCYEKNRLVAGFREWVNKSCAWNLFFRKALRSYDAIYAINKETQNQIESILGRKVEALPELALREQHRNLNIVSKQNPVLSIVFVGRLIGKKGVAFLLDALTFMPETMNWELYIYGDGAECREIEQRIVDNGLESYVRMMGKRPLSEIDEAYQQADVFVLPSLRETSGNVLLEAMAHGIPIVGFDTSFCSKLKMVDCGIFVDTNQPLEKIQRDFCDAIVLLGDNSKIRKEKGLNGYQYANTELIWEKKYDRIYRLL